MKYIKIFSLIFILSITAQKTFSALIETAIIASIVGAVASGFGLTTFGIGYSVRTFFMNKREKERLAYKQFKNGQNLKKENLPEINLFKISNDGIKKISPLTPDTMTNEEANKIILQYNSKEAIPLKGTTEPKDPAKLRIYM